MVLVQRSSCLKFRLHYCSTPVSHYPSNREKNKRREETDNQYSADEQSPPASQSFDKGQASYIVEPVADIIDDLRADKASQRRQQACDTCKFRLLQCAGLLRQ